MIQDSTEVGRGRITLYVWQIFRKPYQIEKKRRSSIRQCTEYIFPTEINQADCY